MRLMIQYVAGIFVGIALVAGGCGKQSADTARLRAQLDRVRSELSDHLSEHRKTESRLRQRVARLETELAVIKRRVARRPGRVTAPPFTGVSPRPEPPGTVERPVPRRVCPAALPDAARKVRRRMRAGKAKKLLRGVKIRRTKALTLSGSGSRTRQVWTGPCFRITLEGGRVATVDLEGVKTKRRRRRRRR